MLHIGLGKKLIIQNKRVPRQFVTCGDVTLSLKVGLLVFSDVLGKRRELNPVLPRKYLECLLDKFLNCDHLQATVFSVVRSCRSKKYRSFGPTCRLPFQGRSVSQAGSQYKSGTDHSLFVELEDEVIRVHSVEMSHLYYV